MDRLLTKKDVKHLVGFSFAEIARKEVSGHFCQRIRIGSRVFWSQNEVLQWIEDHKARRRPK